MYGEIITIGNELTSGRTRDLNAWYAAGRLTESGLKVIRITSVGDDRAKVSEALAAALAASRFVIITGGLGSTDDDLTCQIAAKAFARPLCLDERMFNAIKAYVELRGKSMTPSLEKMAWMPEGSRIINPRAGVCGFSMTEKGVHLYFLPGVPEQMRYLMEKFVLPEIVSRYNELPLLRQKTIKVFGINEPAIAEMVKKLRGKTGEALLGFYPQFPENHIAITLRGNDESLLLSELKRIEKAIEDLLGPCAFARDSEMMEDVTGRILAEKSLTISVAESCTGGLIGHRITSVPGSSAYFLGGVIAYSNKVKTLLLGVSEETLATFGAVSGQTAAQMAKGARELMQSDIGLAVTGIAGPEGGTDEKPVGTVHIGLSARDNTYCGMYRFSGGREQIRTSTATMALDWIRRYLNGYPFLPGL
ncbi:MAG: competence/damage-inducible protein A [Desulfobacteraceae bacterium]|nr:MAG: competence/damage-inducible protein A [Desulfobacteraceae bacterium]